MTDLHALQVSRWCLNKIDGKIVTQKGQIDASYVPKTFFILGSESYCTFHTPLCRGVVEYYIDFDTPSSGSLGFNAASIQYLTPNQTTRDGKNDYFHNIMMSILNSNEPLSWNTPQREILTLTHTTIPDLNSSTFVRAG
jgi:hypothetical protein